MPGGREGTDDTCANAPENPLGRRGGAQGEGVHRREKHRQRRAEERSDQGTGQRDQGAFRDEQQTERPRTNADGRQPLPLPPSTRDVGIAGLVDQESGDEQREDAQRPQIEQDGERKAARGVRFVEGSRGQALPEFDGCPDIERRSASRKPAFDGRFAPARADQDGAGTGSTENSERGGYVGEHGVFGIRRHCDDFHHNVSGTHGIARRKSKRPPRDDAVAEQHPTRVTRR